LGCRKALPSRQRNSIFTNLINNARDALVEQDSESKEIRVFVEGVDEEGNKNVRIKLHDNGPGIPQDQLDEIFEPFFSTKPTSGTGLGLEIVKRLVQLYDGQIGVESKEGKRTIFTITLPENHSG
jgi:signal transduction histidine kinase